MPKLTLSREDAVDLVYGDHETAEVISDIVTGNSRWSVHHELLFKLGGKFYQGTYSRGATEYQDEQPFEHSEPVFNEVEPFESTITKYRVIP